MPDQNEGTNPGESGPTTTEYVLKRYETAITWYWNASRSNKAAYKATRYLTVILGALVTLISSISSATFISEVEKLSVAFAIATPICAACLAIIAGFTQTFQWGAAWSDMVQTAQRLEKERDRIVVLQPGEIEPVKELATLNDLVADESRGFFERLLGASKSAKDEPKPVAPAPPDKP